MGDSEKGSQRKWQLGSGPGDGDGCGVGMFIEAEEGAEGDEVYMSMPDMVWHR